MPESKRTTLHAHLIDLLRDLIAKGELKSGEKILERDLSLRFGVSRTPLREALKVLAAEGIVRLLKNRGAIVADLTLDELHEIVPVVCALEKLAGELVGDCASPAQIEKMIDTHFQMLRCFRKHDLAGYLLFDTKLHELIFEAAGNSALVRTRQSFVQRVLPMRYVVSLEPTQLAREVREHEMILAALNSRDGAALSTLLGQHFKTTVSPILNWLTKRNSSQKLS